MSDPSFSQLLESLSAKTPAPGGGAAAAWAGAIGAALGEMAMRYSIRKKTPEADRDEIASLIGILGEFRQFFLQSAHADAEAYRALNRLQKLAADDPVRMDGWDHAVSEAIAIPNGVIARAMTLLGRLESFTIKCNSWLLSDLAIAAILAEAAGRSAAWNVRVNMPLVDDEEKKKSMAARLAEDLDGMRVITARIEAFCRESEAS